MAERLTREESRARTRGAVLSAARTLFAERGYRAASLDDIAAAAGYSKGAVYSNWPSKEALFLELLDRAAGDAAPEGLDTAATGWALATLDFFLEAVRTPQMREALAQRYRRARREAGAGLAGGRADPEWASWDEVASVAMALGSGLVIQAAIDDDAVDPSLAGRAMERLLRP